MKIQQISFFCLSMLCITLEAKLRIEAMFPLSMGMTMSPYSFVDQQQASVMYTGDGTHYQPIGYGVSIGNPNNANLGPLVNQAQKFRYREYSLEKWFDGYYISSDTTYITRAGFGQWPSYIGWWVNVNQALNFPLTMADMLRAARCCDAYSSPSTQIEYSVHADPSAGNNSFPPDYTVNQNYYHDKRKLFKNQYYSLAFPPTMPGPNHVAYLTVNDPNAQDHTIDYYLAVLFQYNDWKNWGGQVASMLERPYYGSAPKKLADNTTQEPNNFQAEFSVTGAKGVDQIVPSDYFMGMAQDGDIVLLIHAQDPDRGYNLTYDQNNPEDPFHTIWNDKPNLIFYDNEDLASKGFWPTDYSKTAPL